MDVLQQLQAKIPGFPGYGDELDRRRSDELVRAYLGERLAELATRLAPIPAEVQQRVDALLLRTGFADPKSFSARNGVAPGTSLRGATAGDIATDDAETIAVADRAESIDAASLNAYLDEVALVCDRRDAAMRAAATSM